MYFVTITSKDVSLIFKVKTGQQARSLAKLALANGFTYKVNYRPEAREITFEGI